MTREIPMRAMVRYYLRETDPIYTPAPTLCEDVRRRLKLARCPYPGCQTCNAQVETAADCVVQQRIISEKE